MKTLYNKWREHDFRRSFSYFLLFFLPVCTFYLMESFSHNPFETMKALPQLLNIVFFELVMLLLLFLFKSGRLALITESLLFALVGLLNYFIIDFRGTPVMPWDIFSLKTAASVAGDYSYHLDERSTGVSILFILLLALSFVCDIKVNNRKLRMSGIVFSFLLLGCYTGYVQSNTVLKDFKLYDKLFTPTTMTYKDGTVVAFLLQAKYLNVDKPEGYSEEVVTDVISNLTDKVKNETAIFPSEYPNIIVIMNEAFSDLKVLGDYKTNEEEIPFVRSMLTGQENTWSGYLHASVLGGNTANSEFEFLTGLSMAFLPQGSVPYQQYLKNETPSLASYLDELGYQTIAIHPYHASGWHRNVVYPLLGFDSFLSLQDFYRPEILRKYVSDKTSYDKIISLYEEKEPGQPLFLFNVTMQNHSSYTASFDNFTPSITLEGSDNIALSNYLSLLKISDEEIQRLVDYFEQQEENTIIVFFGDHQPSNSVVSDIWKQNDKTSLSLEEEKLRYKVPFFLWANYDIEEKAGIESSMNYLSTFILQAAHLPQNEMHIFLQDLFDVQPIISAIHTVDKSGTSYEIKEQEQELLTYSMLQYYQLFSRKDTTK